MQNNKKINNINRIASIMLVLIFCVCAFCLVSCGDGTMQVENVDVDLTSLSATMVYAKVNDMITNPTAYIGKTIKAKGVYDTSYFNKTQKYYNYVVIKDATACCAQGLEFEYSGGYPDRGAEIVIIGVFGSYTELGLTYYYISANSLMTV